MKDKDIIIEANFRVLEDNGRVAILECPRCGVEFDIHARSIKNMVYLESKQLMVACCPLCATVQKTHEVYT